MARNYNASRNKGRLFRNALLGPHRAALSVTSAKKVFEIGDKVSVTKTGFKSVITGKATWGDYTIKGISGYYSPGSLEARDE